MPLKTCSRDLIRRSVSSFGKCEGRYLEVLLAVVDPKQTFKVGNMDAPGNPNFSTEWFRLRTVRLTCGALGPERHLHL